MSQQPTTKPDAELAALVQSYGMSEAFQKKFQTLLESRVQQATHPDSVRSANTMPTTQPQPFRGPIVAGKPTAAGVQWFELIGGHDDRWLKFVNGSSEGWYTNSGQKTSIGSLLISEMYEGIGNDRFREVTGPGGVPIQSPAPPTGEPQEEPMGTPENPTIVSVSIPHAKELCDAGALLMKRKLIEQSIEVFEGKLSSHLNFGPQERAAFEAATAALKAQIDAAPPTGEGVVTEADKKCASSIIGGLLQGCPTGSVWKWIARYRQQSVQQATAELQQKLRVAVKIDGDSKSDFDWNVLGKIDEQEQEINKLRTQLREREAQAAGFRRIVQHLADMELIEGKSEVVAYETHKLLKDTCVAALSTTAGSDLLKELERLTASEGNLREELWLRDERIKNLEAALAAASASGTDEELEKALTEITEGVDRHRDSDILKAVIKIRRLLAARRAPVATAPNTASVGNDLSSNLGGKNANVPADAAKTTPAPLPDVEQTLADLESWDKPFINKRTAELRTTFTALQQRIRELESSSLPDVERRERELCYIIGAMAASNGGVIYLDERSLAARHGYSVVQDKANHRWIVASIPVSELQGRVAELEGRKT